MIGEREGGRTYLRLDDGSNSLSAFTFLVLFELVTRSTTSLSIGGFALYPISSFITCTILARRLLVSQCRYGS